MSKHCLLVVEDDPVYMEMLVGNLEDCCYEVLQAETGAAAWQAIQSHDGVLDAVLLDRLLPDMDSLSLVGQMKADARLAHIPVIIQTSMTEADEVAAGLSAGAYYYLTKPYRPDALLAIVRAAVEDVHGIRDLQANLRQAHDFIRHIDYVDLWFRTPQEARDLATMVAHVASDPQRVVLGLSELMLNAVEHGNLAITYEEKSLLIAEDRLADEVSRRLELPEYAHRRARLTLERLPGVIEFTLRDEGRGFDWQRYVEMSPDRAFDTHGRGIAMARLLSFESLEYRGIGNEVVARTHA